MPPRLLSFVLIALCLAWILLPAEPPSDSLAKRFVGTWRLVSVEGHLPGLPNFYDAHPTGILMYDPSGWIAVQIATHGDRAAWPRTGNGLHAVRIQAKRSASGRTSHLTAAHQFIALLYKLGLGCHEQREPKNRTLQYCGHFSTCQPDCRGWSCVCTTNPGCFVVNLILRYCPLTPLGSGVYPILYRLRSASSIREQIFSIGSSFFAIIDAVRQQASWTMPRSVLRIHAQAKRIGQIRLRRRRYAIDNSIDN
jgi:hypothetical protein